MAGTKKSGGKSPRNERSGDDASSIAGRGLRDPASLTTREIKILSGSVLTQSPDKPKKKPGR